MSGKTLEVVLLNGRPAAGKSELIDYLKGLAPAERAGRFHIGDLEEFDDFPILWDRFEDDDLRESDGRPRLMSDTSFEYDGSTHQGTVFKERYFWRFLIEKLCRLYEKRLRDRPDYHDSTTAIFEFARGSEHGGLTEAYRALSDTVLSRASTIYINVSWPESCRRNLRRRNPDRPDSILEHSLEQEKMEMLYRDSDWDTFSRADPEFLVVGNHRVPFAVFENEPEKTHDPELLGRHLEEVCARLWRLRTRV